MSTPQELIREAIKSEQSKTGQVYATAAIASALILLSESVDQMAEALRRIAQKV